MPKHVEFPPNPSSLSTPPASLGESGDRNQPIVAWAGYLGKGQQIGPCMHVRAHLAFCFDGVMRVEIDGDQWFIPDRHGIWIPPQISSRLSTAKLVELQTFYIHPHWANKTTMPSQPVVVLATPLMRGIARRLVQTAQDHLPIVERQRLEWVALDEISRLKRQDLCLPGARDPRLVRAINILLETPSVAGNLARLAHEIGTSERTLGRLFQHETGLNWREWRDRMRFMLALEGLQEGQNSTTLAARLGYSTPSAFIAAFRRRTGKSPSQWRRQS